MTKQARMELEVNFDGVKRRIEVPVYPADTPKRIAGRLARAVRRQLIEPS